MKDFICTVTSTGSNNEDSREFHPHAAGMGITGSQEQLDYTMAQGTCAL